MFDAIAHCPLGLEPVCADEIASFGLAVDEALENEGVVTFSASLDELFGANLRLRCVERLSVAFAEFEARRFEELEEQVGELPWERWLDDRRRLLLRVTSRGSKLYHERAIAERMHRAIGARLGRDIDLAEGKELDDPGRDVQLVIVRMEKNRCAIRLDSSGTRLHRRGYRVRSGVAPLRETLAAAILRACGWEVHQPLVDPFCGSGTFLIEAASIARGIAPGAHRAFAMERWPFVDAGRLAELRSAAVSTPPRSVPPILGSDRDARAVAAAKENAARAGVGDAIGFFQNPASAVRRPGPDPGWVITNPPWGPRLAGTGLDRLYRAFGRTLREEFAGYDLGILCPDRGLTRGMGLDFEEGPWLNNGGQHVQLLYAAIPAG